MGIYYMLSRQIGENRDYNLFEIL